MLIQFHYQRTIVGWVYFTVNKPKSHKPSTLVDPRNVPAKVNMTEESSTSSHLSVAMTTAGMTQTTTPQGSFGMEFYFQCAVLIIGVVGTATNGLVLYALLASKQHKQHALIVNQNALDLATCLFVIVIYSVKLCKIYLSGSAGYWLCVIVLSEWLWTWTSIGSIINLAIIAVERYLKIVHPIWSKNKLRSWMTYSAMAFAWIGALVYNLAVVFPTTDAVNGVCYAYVFWQNEIDGLVFFFFNCTSYYGIMILIFTFCYWRILVAIRRQSRVMAAHGGPGSSAAQAQSHHMQSSVIKTMIFVCAFYAILWFPFYTCAFLFNLNPNQTLPDSAYYASLFLAFLYICANPFIYATKFDPVKQVLLSMIPCKKISGQAVENE